MIRLFECGRIRHARRLFAVFIVLAAGAGCVDRAPLTSVPGDSAMVLDYGQSVSRIAFGSCAFQWAEQPIRFPVEEDGRHVPATREVWLEKYTINDCALADGEPSH